MSRSEVSISQRAESVKKRHLDADKVLMWKVGVKDLLEMIYTGKMTDAKTVRQSLRTLRREFDEKRRSQ